MYVYTIPLNATTTAINTCNNLFDFVKGVYFYSLTLVTNKDEPSITYSK